MEEPLNTSIPSPKPSSDKFFKIALIVVGLLLIVGLFINAYLLLKKSNQPKPVGYPAPIPTQAVTSPTLVPDETAIWKTYTNEKYKYSLKYPTYLNIVDRSVERINQFEIVGQENRKILVYAQSGKEDQYYLDTEPQGKINFGNLVGSKYVLPNGYCDGPECSPPIIAAVIYYGSNRYVFSVQGDTNFNNLELQILSTFKFLP